MSFIITIDTGGTFTDAVIQDASGRLEIGKSLTTPDRAFDGMFGAIQAAAERFGLTANDVLPKAERLIFGTTRATNAIVTRNTAKTAFLVTAGFPDILFIREGGRNDAHDYVTPFPKPYIPRRHTFEVNERINAEGGIERALDEAQVIALAEQLVARDFKAVAVCLLWSIVNPAHELRLAELLSKHAPQLAFTLSHRILPIPREYRRASAAALDASLKPLMQGFLQRMEKDLRDVGFQGDLLVSTTVGGCMTVDDATQTPVHLAKSGPAMVPLAAREYAQRLLPGRDVIICDTGGTTFDVGLVRDGEVVRTRETWLGSKYSGELLAISSVDIRSVGAGGGSIAWIDEGGLLCVGPQSAGSVPGPACYGRGGTRPTVTDAAVVAGYIDPALFLGGKMPLDAAAARQAVGRLAERLAMSAEEAAVAILAIADEKMVSAIQDMTVVEGIDPRESVLVAGGGAAGLNIVAVAQALGSQTVVLPQTASALSACGMQFSDIVAEEAASGITTSSQFNSATVGRALSQIASELDGLKRRLKHATEDRCSMEFSVEARYQAQMWSLDVAVPASDDGSVNVAQLVEAFHQAHERAFGIRDPQGVVEFVTWKGRLRVALPRPPRRGLEAANRPSLIKRQPAYFRGHGSLETAFHDGPALPPEQVVHGPAIVLEPTTTIVVPPRASVYLSSTGSYVLTPNASIQ